MTVPALADRAALVALSKLIEGEPHPVPPPSEVVPVVPPVVPPVPPPVPVLPPVEVKPERVPLGPMPAQPIPNIRRLARLTRTLEDFIIFAMLPAVEFDYAICPEPRRAIVFVLAEHKTVSSGVSFRPKSPRPGLQVVVTVFCFP